MLNIGKNGQRMVFEPAIARVEVGDTVTFVPTDKGHFVASLLKENTRPIGAKEFESKLNESLTFKVEKEGIQIFKCVPHYAMGMIGLIVAGKPINLKAIKSVNIRRKKAMKRLLELIKLI